MFLRFFFFNDTATTEIYTLSLHDALPILAHEGVSEVAFDERYKPLHIPDVPGLIQAELFADPRSEEHTSELQSRLHLVCRLLLEKKKYKTLILTRVRAANTMREHDRYDCS